MSDCAALYGVTSLTSEAAVTVAAPTSAAPTNPVSESASVAVSPTSTYIAPTASLPVYPTTKVAPSGGIHPTYTQVGNSTVTTGSVPIQITGAANNLARGAFPAFAIAAGAVLMM